MVLACLLNRSGLATAFASISKQQRVSSYDPPVEFYGFEYTPESDGSHSRYWSDFPQGSASLELADCNPADISVLFAALC